MNKILIVGYDPGTTAALALIDTKGKIIFLMSKRGFKKNQIINEITKRGKPLVIASDRCPLPKSVKKLASSLGCKYYHPPKSLSIEEKSELVSDFTDELENDHERDALAAAFKALNNYSGLFERVESTLTSIGLNKFYNKVIEYVVFGKVENLNEAIKKMLTEKKRPKKAKVRKKVVKKSPKDKTIKKLRGRIKTLEKDIEILKKHNQGLKNKLRTKEDYYKKKLRRRKELTSPVTIQKKLNKLKKRLTEKESIIEKLKNFRELKIEGYIPIIELEGVNKAKDLNERLGLKDRVVKVKNLVNLQVLNDYNIKAVIASQRPEKKILEKVNFPIILEKDISLEKVKNILAIKEKEFEKEEKKARKAGVIQWLKGHKQRKL